MSNLFNADYNGLSEEDKLTVNMFTLDALIPLLESQGHPQIAFQLGEIKNRLDTIRRDSRGS